MFREFCLLYSDQAQRMPTAQSDPTKLFHSYPQATRNLEFKRIRINIRSQLSYENGGKAVECLAMYS